MQEKAPVKNKWDRKLATVVHRPEKEGKFPAIILLHGFTGYKDETRLTTLAEKLESDSFVALRFDCSGFGDSEGTIEKDFRFSNYLSDIDYIYDSVKSLSYVDPLRIGVFGHSMGAMLAIIWCSKHPEIRVICAASPATRMGGKDLLGNVMNEWQATGWFEKTSSRYGIVKIPYPFIEDARKYNVLDYVTKVKQPLLIILGKEDDIVPPEDTKKIYSKANEPKWLLEIEGMDHYYKNNPATLSIVNSEVVTFFKKQLC